jgi:hypothetical protein
MSFNRLAYDPSTYHAGISQSVGPSQYVLATPWHTCQPCLAVNQGDAGRGATTCQSKPVIDVSSELLGITRKASKTACHQYQPSSTPFCEGTSTVRLCAQSREDTRLSNPPCTLRSTGFNRWEWLCTDPQERVLLPFDTMVNSQLVARDSHRPIVPQLFDPSPALPPYPDAPMPDDGAPCNPMRVKQNLPSVSWRSCNEIAQY